MLLKSLSGRKYSLLVVVFLILLSSCKQSEFYEKQDLAKIAGTDNPGHDGGGISNPPSSSGGENNPPSSSGGNNPPTTNPPVVVNPPANPPVTNPPAVEPPTTNPPVVVNPPVVNPPVTNPPAVEPPITNPPVVVNPPVIEPPVTNPPAVEPPVTNPPVVVNPPVIEPPVTNPPAVEPPVTNPPVVVTPPVVTPPVTNPPAVEPPPSLLLSDRSEFFTQNKAKNGDVDILWVIDDSGSMADEQDALGRNFNSFINQFIARDIDFKMAITTTDGTSSRNGKMVGDSSKLTRASAKGNKAAFINNFTKWVKVGTNGSGIEQGLQTSVSFTDRYASSFLRPDAYFVVVYISDEEDQSDKKVNDYIAKLQALKKNKGMVKAYSIVTVKDYGNNWETLGKRYMKVSEATAGTVRDIKKDFAETLVNMGGNILDLVDSFALTESPYENKIEVFVNNVKVTSGITFDAVQRTLKFSGNAVPSEGAKIEVRYKVKAGVIGAM